MRGTSNKQKQHNFHCFGYELQDLCISAVEYVFICFSDCRDHRPRSKHCSVNHHVARHASCLEAPRDSIFTHCLNPLHRFHRISLPMHRLLESTIADALPFVNAMLDDVNTAYSGFETRFELRVCLVRRKRMQSLLLSPYRRRDIRQVLRRERHKPF